MTFTVKSAERAVRPGRAASLVFGFEAGQPVEGWKVEVEAADGSRLLCSLLDGEWEWYVDSVFSPKGVPIQVTSFGSRACASVASPELVEALVAYKKQEVK